MSVSIVDVDAGAVLVVDLIADREEARLLRRVDEAPSSMIPRGARSV